MASAQAIPAGKARRFLPLRHYSVAAAPQHKANPAIDLPLPAINGAAFADTLVADMVAEFIQRIGLTNLLPIAKRNIARRVLGKLGTRYA